MTPDRRTRTRRDRPTGLRRVLLPAVAAAGTAMLTALPGAAAGAAVALPAQVQPAPLRAVTGDVVPGQYVVVLRSGRTAPSVLRDLHRRDLIGREFHRALRGFTARLAATDLAAVRRDPQVAYVEPDQVIRTALVPMAATRTGATWGLDRIDQRARPLDGRYTSARTGAGVTAYVIDTGIRSTHSGFGGRVGGGYSTVADGRGTQDCNGHGTHVAGTIASSVHGVAPGARLVPVRVLDCEGAGTSSSVIAGIDWVTANRTRPAVANLSLGGGTSTALDDAVKRSIASGVSYAIAAGNSSLPACLTSPARVPAALTVGASQADDSTSGFSNWGSCIDLFAPGTDITSSWIDSDTSARAISGTSMAAPHVAGVAALYLQAHPAATPAQVATAVVGASTPGVLGWVLWGSPNKLLHSTVG